MSAIKKIVSTDDIFIVTPDEKSYKHIYGFLRSADFRNAYAKDTQELFNIGLEAVLWVLEQKLPETKTPDLIYLETSLFPERTRINNKIVDFLCLRINKELDGDRGELLLEVFRQYKLIYTALHETQNTVYYVPEFLQRPDAMRMVFSEYVKGAEYSESAEDRLREREKLVEINKKIEEISNRPNVKDEITARASEQFKGWTQKPDGHATYGDDNTFMTRDFLTRQGSPEEGRNEKWLDLQLNAHIFHKLFHQRAFSDYVKTFLLCIPIVGAGEKRTSRRRPHRLDEGESQHLIGQGALFILLAYKQGDVTLSDPENLATDIAKTVSYVLKDYFISYLYTSTREMVDEVINRSLRAAAGAIMSRNISHNIGSHVAPRTTISAIEERLESFLLRP